jgi:membrane-associated protein
VDALNDFVVSLASSWWILPVVLVLVVIDGFFPPVPSESVIVGLSAVGIASGFPSPLLLLLVAFVGSFLGDNIAFLIGRRIRAGNSGRCVANE